MWLPALLFRLFNHTKNSIESRLESNLIQSHFDRMKNPKYSSKSKFCLVSKSVSVAFRFGGGSTFKSQITLMGWLSSYEKLNWVGFAFFVADVQPHYSPKPKIVPESWDCPLSIELSYVTLRHHPRAGGQLAQSKSIESELISIQLNWRTSLL